MENQKLMQNVCRLIESNKELLVLYNVTDEFEKIVYVKGFIDALIHVKRSIENGMV